MVFASRNAGGIAFAIAFVINGGLGRIFTGSLLTASFLSAFAGTCCFTSGSFTSFIGVTSASVTSS